MKQNLRTFVAGLLMCLGTMALNAQGQNNDKLLMTIGCLSDLHSDDQYLGKNKIRESVTYTLNKMKSDGEHLDILLLGGDYTGGYAGSTNEKYWKTNRQMLKEATESAFDAGKTPYVIYANGNHEYQAGNGQFNSGDYYTTPMKDRLGELKETSTPTAAQNECFYEKTNDSKFNLLAAYHYQVNGIDFVVLNTGKFLYANQGNYYYSLESVNWVAAKMKALFDENPDRLVFFITHIPFSDSNSITKASKGMQNTDRNSADVLKTALAKYPNIIMLYGHDHKEDISVTHEKTSQRITLYNTEGTKISTTDEYHIDGLPGNVNAKRRGLKTAEGDMVFYVKNLNSGYLNASATGTSHHNTDVAAFSDTPQTFTISQHSAAGDDKTLFDITTAVYGETRSNIYYGRISELTDSAFKFCDKAFETDPKYGSYLYKVSKIENNTITASIVDYNGLSALTGNDRILFVGQCSPCVMGNTPYSPVSSATHVIDISPLKGSVSGTGNQKTITVTVPTGTDVNNYLYSLEYFVPTQSTFYGKLTVASGGNGSVSISGVSGNVWQGSVSSYETSGTQTLSLSAVAQAGYELAGWSENGGTSIIQGSNTVPFSYEFMLTSTQESNPTSKTLTAVFVKKPEVTGTPFWVKNSEGNYMGLSTDNKLQFADAQQTWGFSGPSNNQFTVQTVNGNGNAYYLQGGKSYSVSTSSANLYFYELSNSTTANRTTTLTAGKQYLIVYVSNKTYYMMDKNGKGTQLNTYQSSSWGGGWWGGGSSTQTPYINTSNSKDNTVITLSSSGSDTYKFTLETPKVITPVPLYGKLAVESSEGGKVYMSENTGAQSGSTSWSGSTVSSTGSATKTLYLYAKSTDDSYMFKGWSTDGTEAGIISGSSTSPYAYSFTYTSDAENTPTSKTLTAIFTQGPKPSLVTSFMGSMTYHHYTADGLTSSDSKMAVTDLEKHVVQALMIYVYEDRVVMQMKNYGKVGDWNKNDFEVDDPLIPYTIIRKTKNDGSGEVVLKENEILIDLGDGGSAVNVKEDGLDISDAGNINNLKITQKIEDVKVDYSRNFKSTAWEAWYAPFDFCFTSEIAENFSFAKIGGAFANNSGEINIAFVKLKVGEWVNANTPYMVKVKNPGNNAISLPNTTLWPTTEEIKFSISSSEQVFSFIGLYGNKPLEGDDSDWYALNCNAEFKHPDASSDDDDFDLHAFRFFMKVTPREDNIYAECGATTPLNNGNGVKVRIVGEDEATGLDLVEKMNDVNGAYYDLTGRKVKLDRNGNLPGMVIHNRKKYIRK